MNKDMQEAYDSAMLGGGVPDYMVIECEECGLVFEFTALRKPTLCEHLQKKLDQWQNSDK